MHNNGYGGFRRRRDNRETERRAPFWPGAPPLKALLVFNISVLPLTTPPIFLYIEIKLAADGRCKNLEFKSCV